MLNVRSNVYNPSAAHHCASKGRPVTREQQSEFDHLMHQDGDTHWGHNDEPDTTARPAYATVAAFLNAMLSEGIARLTSTNLSYLNWRLTNGPLAGMHIRAVSAEGAVTITLSDVSSQQLARVIGSLAGLEASLRRELNSDVKVKVSRADNTA